MQESETPNSDTLSTAVSVALADTSRSKKKPETKSKRQVIIGGCRNPIFGTFMVRENLLERGDVWYQFSTH
jgi:hypothetical protein